MIITSLAIVGTGAAVPLATTSVLRNWVQFQAPSTNVANVLIGGPEVTPVIGYPLPKGSGQMLPVVVGIGLYDLSSIRVYVAVGDTLQVLHA